MALRSLLLAAASLWCVAERVSAEPLRYGIEPDQVVPYRVTITVDLPSTTETMTGEIAFTGKKATRGSDDRVRRWIEEVDQDEAARAGHVWFSSDDAAANSAAAV